MRIADPDPEPTFHFVADPDPSYHFDADPDPTFQFDPYPQHSAYDSVLMFRTIREAKKYNTEIYLYHPFHSVHDFCRVVNTTVHWLYSHT